MARNFNGVSESAETTAGVVSTAVTNVSAAFWAKPSSVAGTLPAFCNGPQGTNGYGVYVCNGDGKWGLNLPFIAYVAGSISASTTAWQHIILVGDASNWVLYVDGSSALTTAVGAGTPTTATYIGAAGAPGNTYAGDMAEAGFWSAPLDAAEIAALVKGYSPRVIRPTSLVAYWPLMGRASPEPDIRGIYPLTLSGTRNADHPRVIYPRRS